MDQEEITVLANSVYEFKEALKKLTNIFNRDESVQENIDSQRLVHDCLSDVLHILKHLLEMYPGLQSTEMLMKAHNLVKHVQGYTSNEDSQQMYDFINQLATAFSIRVSEYLVGDLDIYVSPHLEVTSSSTSVDGIYRVSGVKSKVEKLCQEFETDGENVELSCVHPNVIANVLKLYLRQLPQPLFTFNLYPEFVRFAKHWPCGSNKELSTAVEELRKIIMKLPKNYYNTVKIIVQHLKRVSNQDDINNMSPSNLGIVFGPTLLRTSDGQSSINSLVDTVYQSRAIELIITWADQLFIA
ncbi:rho GTPase-activating protein 29-like isoform X3 [Lycorma delicatula]|uniref:rho GTPase-activating protein 29-like isoform X3 n=1 Tax=Lycorma delicatula TaxID=130591 RepID=UPI003F50DAAB